MFNKIYLFFVLFIFIFSLQAQTQKWHLKWDANNESDMFIYRIFKGTAPLPTNKVDSVSHPLNVFEDTQLEKGVLYYYRVQAVNQSLRGSPYSDQVSAAIPLITGFPQEIAMSANETTVLNLDNYVTDPDHADNLLTWTVSGNSAVQVAINQSNHNATIQTPASWSAQENLIFTCSDPDTFFDTAALRITSEADPQAQAPQFAQIPRQTTQEDSAFELDLLDFVTDNDSSPDKLHFQITPGQHLQTQLSGSLLQIIPQSNWFGNSSVNVTVTDESQLSDVTDIAVTVSAVNDAPIVLSLPQTSMPQDTSITLNVSEWATDIDDDDGTLQWSFTNYFHIQLDYQQQNKILRISSPQDWSGFEYVQATVQDSSGESTTDTLLIQVTETRFPPSIQNFPDVSFSEDDSGFVQLNDYVTDKDTPPGNLFWRVSGNHNIEVYIDHSAQLARFTAQKDWFGNEDCYVVVSDPDQSTDSVLINVQVEAVNDAPVFLTLPAINLSEELHKSIDLSYYVHDVDDNFNQLQFSYSGNSHVLVSISSRGQATFSADSLWYGQEVISLGVTDRAGAEDAGNVTVFKQNLAHAPSISGLPAVQVDEDAQTSLELANYVSDPDQPVDQLSWSFSGEEHIQLVYDAQNMHLQITPRADWFGVEKISLRVEDTDHYFDIDTLSITVLPVNDAPQILPVPNISIFGSSVYTLDLKEFIFDADGLDDLVNIELLGAHQGFIGYYIDMQNYELIFFTPADYTGAETYLLRITDSKNIQASAVFSVEVRKDQLEHKISMDYFGGQTNLRFSWQTINLTKDYIEFGESRTYDQTSEIDAQYTRQHEVLLDGLLPETRYHFRIVSVDEQQKISYSADSVFITGRQNNAINVFPIPWKAAAGINNDGIYFTNLQAGDRIRIYNLAGEPVYRNDEPGRVFKWNIKNNSGRDVSSGLYIYTISDKAQKRKYSGKIIIIR